VSECVCVCDTKKGLFFCPDYRYRGGAIAAAAMCDCGQNAAYALITATSVSSHPVNENSSDEPIINQLVHRPNGFRLYYSLDLFFIPRPVPHKYRVCVYVWVYFLRCVNCASLILTICTRYLLGSIKNIVYGIFIIHWSLLFEILFNCNNN